MTNMLNVFRFIKLKSSKSTVTIILLSAHEQDKHQTMHLQLNYP